MELHKQKINQILKAYSYSSKKIKNCRSNPCFNNQHIDQLLNYKKKQEYYYTKNKNPFQKKNMLSNKNNYLQTSCDATVDCDYISNSLIKNNNNNFNNKQQRSKKTQKKQLITKLQKQSSQKKYLINYTAYGTPFQKSTMLSYISTPNQKSFKKIFNNYNYLYNNNKIDNLHKKIKKIKKGESKGLKKQRQQLINNYNQKLPSSNQEDTFFEKCVRVKFIIFDSYFNKRKTVNKQQNNLLTKSPVSNDFINQKQNDKIIYRIFPGFTSFQSMRNQFLSEILSIPLKLKNIYYGFLGFETIPYNYEITNLINNNRIQGVFEDLLNRQIKDITLKPIFLKNEISYQNLDFKDFQIISYLGSGGFSSVYLAKCLIDGEMCALKFIRKDTITTAKKLRMLQNQRNILFSVTHPNLIDLYYAFQTKSYIVFGLEYCPYGNLFNFLQKTKGLNENQAKIIFKQVLDGLQYLHDNNILFRDIKLENILFDGQGNIKITDFGLSKPQISEEQITYSYCGSPQYMAPQMLSKQGHSFGVDYYALGVLLYELFYGKSPFFGTKKQDIFVAIMSTDPVFPKEPWISKQAKALIKGLLQKNPKHRIGSLKGIKQIRSHPWLRNDYILNSNKKKFDFHQTFLQDTISKKRRKFQKQNQTEVNQIITILKNNPKGIFHNQVDPYKVRQRFQQEKQYKNAQKYFFQQSFVNKNLLDKIQKNICKFKDFFGFSSQEKEKSLTRKNAYINNYISSNHKNKKREKKIDNKSNEKKCLYSQNKKTKKY